MAANQFLQAKTVDTDTLNTENGALLADNPATDVPKLLSLSDKFGSISENADKIDISQELKQNQAFARAADSTAAVEGTYGNEVST